MYGNGVMTGGQAAIIPAAPRVTPQAPLQGVPGFFAAARGATTTSIAVRPTAATTPREAGATASGSGFRGLRNTIYFNPFTLYPVFLYPWVSAEGGLNFFLKIVFYHE